MAILSTRLPIFGMAAPFLPCLHDNLTSPRGRFTGCAAQTAQETPRTDDLRCSSTQTRARWALRPSRTSHCGPAQHQMSPSGAPSSRPWRGSGAIESTSYFDVSDSSTSTTKRSTSRLALRPAQHDSTAAFREAASANGAWGRASASCTSTFLQLVAQLAIAELSAPIRLRGGCSEGAARSSEEQRGAARRARWSRQRPMPKPSLVRKYRLEWGQNSAEMGLGSFFCK